MTHSPQKLTTSRSVHAETRTIMGYPTKSFHNSVEDGVDDPEKQEAPMRSNRYGNVFYTHGTVHTRSCASCRWSAQRTITNPDTQNTLQRASQKTRNRSKFAYDSSRKIISGTIMTQFLLTLLSSQVGFIANTIEADD